VATVILVVTIRGSCYLGGSIYSLDCLLGVITMLVFPVCEYVENYYKILIIYVVHFVVVVVIPLLLISIDNKM
jgi:hypothetical protein